MRGCFCYHIFNIQAIVSLPAHAFQPWTPTRTSLLFAQKKTRAEEKKWAEVFARHRNDVATAVRWAEVACRGILHTRKNSTAEQVVSHQEDLYRALDDLALLIDTDAEVGSAAWVEASLVAAKALNIDAEAFTRTVSDLDGKAYLGVIVGEIGYRRTKRAENQARNDLFRAITHDENNDVLVIRNLNDAPETWTVDVTANGEDALSRMCAELRWQ